jgi:hypothetical protein
MGLRMALNWNIGCTVYVQQTLDAGRGGNRSEVPTVTRIAGNLIVLAVMVVVCVVLAVIVDGWVAAIGLLAGIWVLLNAAIVMRARGRSAQHEDAWR